MRTIAEKLAGTAAVIQVNTQENPALALRFGVQPVDGVLPGSELRGPEEYRSQGRLFSDAEDTAVPVRAYFQPPY